MNRGDASRTAQYVALFRAIETRMPPGRRLFEDPLAELFLTPNLSMVAALSRVPRVAGRIASFIDRHWGGALSSVVARTKLIDDTIVAARAGGVRQFAILGAGFDSRAYRLRALHDVPVFEVDHPDTLARKSNVLRRASVRLPPNVRLVECDFQEGEIGRAMTRAGYAVSVPSFILWEGVTAYLTEPAVDSTLRWCAQSAPESELLFTYIHRAALDDPVAFAGARKVSKSVKAAGEPWRFGFYPTELASYLETRGLILEQDIGSAEYRARYLPVSRETPQGHDFYRLAIARVAAD